MQGVILAAGIGSRLKELTEQRPISTIEVNGIPLLQRMLLQMDALGLSKIIVAVGYKKEMLLQLAEGLDLKTPVIFVENEAYARTNACGSLHCIGKALAKEDVLIVESDGIYDDRLYRLLMADGHEDAVLTSAPQVWVDGPIMKTDAEGAVLETVPADLFYLEEEGSCTQSIHMYKLSRTAILDVLLPYLEQGGRDAHFMRHATIVDAFAGKLSRPLYVCGAGTLPWYEINDMHDLDLAQSMFATGTDKLSRYLRRFGGYWRYENMLDFCYLVNPFFPNDRFMAEMLRNFDTLLREYPSGMRINSLLAGKFFGMTGEYICVGNGTSELIKVLMEEEVYGKLGLIYPTFEEYANRMKPEDLIPYMAKQNDFRYDAEKLIAYFDDKDICALLIVNPDNPSGLYLERSEIIRLAEWAERKQIMLIVDESFADFAESKEPPTLLEQRLLQKYPCMVVLKSISKSYGVPGLRLGVLAGGDTALIARIKKEVPIWNINSFAEYFMQIFNTYRTDFNDAIRCFKEVRARYLEKLALIPGLTVYPTQANYVMCRIDSPHITSLELADRLLNESNILIKDLHNKSGLEGESYIRLSVKTDEENNAVVNELMRILGAYENA